MAGTCDGAPAGPDEVHMEVEESVTSSEGAPGCEEGSSTAAAAKEGSARAPPKCSFCGKKGHTITHCAAQGAALERSRRKAGRAVKKKTAYAKRCGKTVKKRNPSKCSVCRDPHHDMRRCQNPGAEQKREVATAAAAKAREIRTSEFFQKYDITDEEKVLPEPEVYPGRVREEVARNARHMSPAINTFLKTKYSKKVIKIVNDNLREDALSIVSRELEREDNHRKLRRVQETGVSDAGVKKGVPGFASTAARPPALRVEEVRCGRSVESAKRKRSEETIFWSKMTSKEFRGFLAILLYSSRSSERAWSRYWDVSGVRAHHPIPRAVMSRDRFLQLHHAFRFTEKQILDFERRVNAHLRQLWIPASVAAVDESMIPHKGKSNPHHVYIMRKPNSNGLKMWSLVEYSGYFWKFSLFRRGQKPERASATIARMAEDLPEGSTIVGDSLFGSMESMENLAEQKKYCILSTTQNRPSDLMKDHLCAQLAADGDMATCYGTVKRVDGSEMPFLANSFQSDKKKINTISSVYSANPAETAVVTMVTDETEENQEIASQREEVRPEVRIHYGKMMDFLDNADAAISQALCNHRKMHWTTAYMIWVYTMLFVVNARKLYHSSSGLDPGKSVGEWVDQVIGVLRGAYPDPKEHPRSYGGFERRNCKACWDMSGLVRRTYRQCSVCGPICKHCDEGMDGKKSVHERYATKLGKTTRTRYIRSNFD